MKTRVAASPIKVIVAGVNGRMGRAFVQAFHEDPDIQLVGAFGRAGASYVGADIGALVPLSGSEETGILVRNGIVDCLAGCKPDVLLDVTQAEPAFHHAKIAIENGLRPVVGTSGLSAEQVRELMELAASKAIGALIVPNFSIGAVLMMEFARQAGQFFKDVEVVEMHHTGKKDAPSGTAMHTVEKLASSRDAYNVRDVAEKELLEGARGALGDAKVRVHSLRLPGKISHQEVFFGAPGELLTIKHESFNTSCFMEGIKLAINSVMNLKGLRIGLDSVLFESAA